MCNKMRTEVPVCTRCCFCLPLRYGLIAWGYVRLIIALVMMTGASILFYGMLNIAIYRPHIIYQIFALMSGSLVLLALTDIALNIVFIIGGHTKSYKLLKAYFVYSIILCALTTLIGVGLTIFVWYLCNVGDLDSDGVFQAWVIVSDVVALLAQIAVQVYVILLVRSEIIKLRSNCHFRFVNNAAESECSMKCDREIASGEECAEEFYDKGSYDTKGTCQFIGYVARNNEYS